MPEPHRERTAGASRKEDGKPAVPLAAGCAEPQTACMNTLGQRFAGDPGAAKGCLYAWTCSINEVCSTCSSSFSMVSKQGRFDSSMQLVLSSVGVPQISFECSEMFLI